MPESEEEGEVYADDMNFDDFWGDDDQEGVEDLPAEMDKPKEEAISDGEYSYYSDSEYDYSYSYSYASYSDSEDENPEAAS